MLVFNLSPAYFILILNRRVQYCHNNKSNIVTGMGRLGVGIGTLLKSCLNQTFSLLSDCKYKMYIKHKIILFNFDHIST